MDVRLSHDALKALVIRCLSWLSANDVNLQSTISSQSSSYRVAAGWYDNGLWPRFRAMIRENLLGVKILTDT